MEGKIDLKLNFKGNRDYIQGGDIHDALCDELQSRAGTRIASIDLVFHRIARTVISGEVVPAGTPPVNEAAVVMRFQAAGQNWIVRLYDTPEPVIDRKPYDEGPVIAARYFDAERQAISAPAIEGYSTIEIIIVLFKELLARVLPEAQGKWLFTRLQLKESIRSLPVQRIELVFAGQSGMRLARAKILADGREVGVIFYSLIPKS